MAEYEPHEALARIKRNLESLKKKTIKTGSVEYKSTVDKLRTDMDFLINVFKETAEEMELEEKAEERIEKELEPLVAKVNEIEEENKQIAQGILVIADMLNELKGEKIPKPAQPVFLQQKAVPPPVTRPMPPRAVPPLREFPPPIRRPIRRPIPPRAVPPPRGFSPPITRPILPRAVPPPRGFSPPITRPIPARAVPPPRPPMPTRPPTPTFSPVEVPFPETRHPPRIPAPFGEQPVFPPPTAMPLPPPPPKKRGFFARLFKRK